MQTALFFCLSAKVETYVLLPLDSRINGVIMKTEQMFYHRKGRVRMSLVNLLLWLMLALIPLVCVLILAEQNEMRKAAVRSSARTRQSTVRYPDAVTPASRPHQAEAGTDASAAGSFRFFDITASGSDRPADLNFDWMQVSRTRTKPADIREASSASHHCA